MNPPRTSPKTGDDTVALRAPGMFRRSWHKHRWVSFGLILAGAATCVLYFFAPTKPAAPAHAPNPRAGENTRPLASSEKATRPQSSPTPEPVENPFATLHDPQDMRGNLRHHVASNLEACLAWAASLAISEERRRIQSEICWLVAERSPEEAARLAKKIGLVEADADIVPRIVERWTVQDFRGAWSWAEQLAPGESRDRCLAHIASHVAKIAPDEAADVVTKSMSAGPLQFAMTLHVLQEWTRRDFPQAALWASRFPEGELKERALDTLDQSPP